MREKKTVFKLFFVWDFEKRRALAERDGAGGWVLDNTGFSFYTFVRCEPGEYIIRLEMNPSSDYRAFVKELGAEYIGGCVNWVYFRRKAELGSFELLSDIDSRLTHLSRIDRMLSLICLANLILGITNSLNQARYGWLNLLCAAMLSLCTGAYPRHESSAGKATQFARMICQSLLRHNCREKKEAYLWIKRP